MKNLLEIARIVTKKKVKKIEIFDEYSLKNKQSKFNEFYIALTERKFKNDRDAAAKLYNCSPTDAKYRQLKSRFKKRLLNTMFFLDVNKPGAPNYDRAYFTCNKEWTLVKILLSYKATQTAMSQARHILTTALKFKFADVIVNCARILRDNAASEGDIKSYEEYHEYINQYSNILEAEIRSEELLQRVMMFFQQPDLPGNSDLIEIEGYSDALISLSEMYDSPVIYYNMYLAWALRFEIQKDFESMLQVCEQAEKYVEDNPDFLREEKLITFFIKKMSAYLHLRDYRNGKVSAETCLQKLSDNSAFWFEFMEYYLLLAIHTENYIQAIAIHQQTVENGRYKKLNEVTKNKWQLFERYLGFIQKSEGKKNPILAKKQTKSNRTSRKEMLEEVNFPKEQKVLGILTLILQILYLLEERKLIHIGEKIDQLKSLASRSAKKEEFIRLRLFIKLLIQLKRADFQIDDLKTTEKYLEELKNKTFFYRGDINDLEVIPYERIWEMILSYID